MAISPSEYLIRTASNDICNREHRRVACTFHTHSIPKGRGLKFLDTYNLLRSNLHVFNLYEN